jgi:hypothetical protein
MHIIIACLENPPFNAIIEHFDVWPLLGYKAVSYDLFCKKFKHQCHGSHLTWLIEASRFDCPFNDKGSPLGAFV